MSPGPPPVLCAEDEESDGFILRRAFAKENAPNPLVIVKDGREALDYLSGAPPYQDRREHPLPALLLLDLKMPRLNGFDVLSWLGTRPDLATLPVVVLSSSLAEADMLQARRLGAKEFIVKPTDLAEYSKVVRGVHARWLDGKPA
jgi:CheY-like chemotaxis protein